MKHQSIFLKAIIIILFAVFVSCQVLYPPSSYDNVVDPLTKSSSVSSSSGQNNSQSSAALRTVNITLDDTLKVKLDSDLKLKNDLKLKLKNDLKLKAPSFWSMVTRYVRHFAPGDPTNWMVVGVTPQGQIFTASSNGNVFSVSIPINISLCLYIMEIIGTESNYFLCNYANGLTMAPIALSPGGGLDPINLSNLDTNGGRLYSPSNPSDFSLLNLIIDKLKMDNISPGILDFAGAIDQNTNGIPDIVESGNTGTPAATVKTDATSNPALLTGTNYYTALMAADENLTLYHDTAAWSNTVVTFTMDTNFAVYKDTYASEWAGLAASVALTPAFIPLVSNTAYLSEWSNVAALVVLAPSFAAVIDPSLATAVQALSNTVVNNPVWVSNYQATFSSSSASSAASISSIVSSAAVSSDSSASVSSASSSDGSISTSASTSVSSSSISSITSSVSSTSSTSSTSSSSAASSSSSSIPVDPLPYVTITSPPNLTPTFNLMLPIFGAAYVADL